MELKAGYPTPEHEAAALSAVEFFRSRPEVSAVLLTCSCARGQASRDSCLDMVAFLSPEAGPEARSALERAWAEFEREDAAVAALAKVGAYTHVDLDFHDGSFSPVPRGPTSGRTTSSWRSAISSRILTPCSNRTTTTNACGSGGFPTTATISGANGWQALGGSV